MFDDVVMSNQDAVEFVDDCIFGAMQDAVADRSDYVVLCEVYWWFETQEKTVH